MGVCVNLKEWRLATVYVQYKVLLNCYERSDHYTAHGGGISYMCGGYIVNQSFYIALFEITPHLKITGKMPSFRPWQ